MNSSVVGILGGTFDPIHYGHLRLALELYQQLNLKEIRFIPCQKPVLDKTAQASSAQRLRMMQLALSNQSGMVIDERELQRATPSYTVETLRSLRQECGNTPLALIMGRDTFSSLPRWHNWQKLIELAHLVVVPRPGFSAQENRVGWIAIEVTDLIKPQQIIQDATLLSTAAAGYVFFADVTPLAISSTFIRQQIKDKLSPRYLLPDAVLQFIQQENLYQKL